MAVFILLTIDFSLVKVHIHQDKLLKSAIWETNNFVQGMLPT
jgi:hypothetical protein